MKINANELLLLNKKVQLQDGESAGSVSITPTTPEAPQTAMNALMFQGRANLMSNPGLAQRIGVMKEENTDNKESDNQTQFRASFSNSLAFQGKSKAAKMALTGLASIAAAGLMSSCVEQEVTVDMTAITEMMSQLQALLQDMAKQQTITNQQLQQMNQYMLQLMEMVRNGQISQEEFYKRMYDFMLTNQTNQEVIIAQLVANGNSVEEAKQLIQNLIDAVNNGTMTMQEALAKLQELLGSIDSKLSVIINCMNDLKNGVDKLVEQGEISQQKADETNAKLDALLAEVRAGRMTQEQFYRQALRYMVLDNAISRAMLNQLVKNGKSQEEANAALNKLIELANKENASLEELKAALAEVQAMLGSIDSTLKEMNETLKGLANDFQKFIKSYEANEKQQAQYLRGIYRNGRIQTEILAQSMFIQSQMASDLNQVKKNTSDLKNIVNNRFDELMEALKNSGSFDGITKSDLEAMLARLGITIADAINMSQSQLLAAIQNFEKTYIETEQKQTEELQSIQIKLDTIQIFNNINSANIINAINNLANEMSKENGDVLNALAKLQAELNKIQEQLDNIYRRIDKAANDINAKIDMLNGKMNGVLGQLFALNKNVKDIKGEIKKIQNAQLVANGYLSNLNNSVNEIKVALKDLEGKGNITLEQLRELWEERDADKLAKVEEMLKKFGLDKLDPKLTTIEKLLKSIDDKMDMIKDNNDLLKQILAKLEAAANKDPQALLNKLDEILEAIKNIKCDCNCSNGNNEGILGALDGILG